MYNFLLKKTQGSSVFFYVTNIEGTDYNIELETKVESVELKCFGHMIPEVHICFMAPSMLNL